MKPEAAVQRDITRFLKDLGGAVYSTTQGYRKDPGGTRCTPGIPDLIIFVGGHFAFVEVKAGKGKLSAFQELFRVECETAAVDWQCWRDVDEAWAWAVAKGIIEEAA